MRQNSSRMLLQAVAIGVLMCSVTGCGTNLSLPFGTKSRATPTIQARQLALKGQAHSKAKKHPAAKLRHSKQHNYAVHVLPVLDRSTRTFDQAVSAVASISDMTALDNACSSFGNNINNVAGFFEGVPHPSGWYTPTGHLHHSLAGTYHDMLGAIQLCQTAAEGQDSSTAASAIADMGRAASQLHQQDNY